MSLSIEPIARVVSPYKEKFGIPRQPGLAKHANGYLQMQSDFSELGAFEGLDGFSHLWVIFEFHACEGQSRLRVRPPRLGGNTELGVFATRSPFRPNNLGLSVLGFEGIEEGKHGLRLRVSGLDLLDGTPVYDIKPYVPYVDALPEAKGGFAATAPTAVLAVVFVGNAEISVQQLPEGIRDLIVETLSLDPRPAYKKEVKSSRVYGVRLDDFDVRWRVEGERVLVEEIILIQ